MELSPLTDQISGTDTITWETVTENTVRQWMLSNQASNVRVSKIYEALVRANIEDQYTVSRTQVVTTGGTRRNLQEVATETVESVIIQYKIIMQYRSTSQSDANQLVWTAFNTPAKQDEYISDLQVRSATFEPVAEAQVAVDGWVPPPTQAPSPEPVKNTNIAVIAGASVGGVALIVLIALLIFRSRGGNSDVDESKGIEVTLATPSTGKNMKVSTEILVEPQDDVSTLGDPMFGQGGMIMGGIDRDEMTATVGDDYDYTKHYRQQRGPLSLSGTTNTRDRTISEDMSKMSSVQSVSLSKVGKMGENIFADDSSFEEQFKDPEERIDVVAPAGKLGMVIDTPNGGIPVVHAIKDTSVLIDQVRVGDRLLSVDGEDCTGMTAMQVSKLISLKSTKPVRVLVFARALSAPKS